MSLSAFDQLPDAARLWIFGADRALTHPDAQRLLAGIDRFLADWTAHRAHLTAARDGRHDRFLMVGVDETAAGASGCSIDALVHEIQRLEGVLGIKLADRASVTFRRGEEIDSVSRPQFADLAAGGDVNPDTPVFDNTLTTVGELRAGRWEVPARSAWHGRAFFRVGVA
jgi:hypothetical protein